MARVLLVTFRVGEQTNEYEIDLTPGTLNEDFEGNLVPIPDELPGSVTIDLHREWIDEAAATPNNGFLRVEIDYSRLVSSS